MPLFLGHHPLWHIACLQWAFYSPRALGKRGREVDEEDWNGHLDLYPKTSHRGARAKQQITKNIPAARRRDKKITHCSTYSSNRLTGAQLMVQQQ